MSLAIRQADYIQQRAVAVGAVHFLCPQCTYFNKFRVNWRCPKVTCRHCHKIYTVGMAFSTVQIDRPPFNGWYTDDYTRWTNNVRDTLPPGRFNTGRVVGTTRWICPKNHVCAARMDMDTGRIVCDQCGSTFYVSLILYRARNRQPNKTPVDWIVPETILDV